MWFGRYTLTEGDFHHLKKARLTHLHLPPAPCDLKILTIMECDSTESSTVNISETSAAKLPLAIYQVSDTFHQVLRKIESVSPAVLPASAAG